MTTWKSITGFLGRVGPKYNFLTFHCGPLDLTANILDLYIISSSLLSSLLILAGGNITYIDALFFGTGACTQAGLNPIDVNLLTTWQQVPLLTFSNTRHVYSYSQ